MSGRRRGSRLRWSVTATSRCCSYSRALSRARAARRTTFSTRSSSASVISAERATVTAPKVRPRARSGTESASRVSRARSSASTDSSPRRSVRAPRRRSRASARSRPWPIAEPGAVLLVAPDRGDVEQPAAARGRSRRRGAGPDQVDRVAVADEVDGAPVGDRRHEEVDDGVEHLLGPQAGGEQLAGPREHPGALLGAAERGTPPRPRRRRRRSAAAPGPGRGTTSTCQVRGMPCTSATTTSSPGDGRRRRRAPARTGHGRRARCRRARPRGCDRRAPRGSVRWPGEEVVDAQIAAGRVEHGDADRRLAVHGGQDGGVDGGERGSGR